MPEIFGSDASGIPDQVSEMPSGISGPGVKTLMTGNIRLPERSYAMEQDKIDLFLASAPSQEVKAIYEKFIKNLVHVSFETFYNALIEIIPSVKNLKNYAVMFDQNGDHKSKKWAYSLVKDQLTKPVCTFCAEAIGGQIRNISKRA